MSSFLVSRTHIDALMTAAVRWGLVHAEDDPKALGRQLWEVNLQAVYGRGEADDAEVAAVAGYRFTQLFGEPDPMHVFKLTRGYTYQASDATGWDDSSAKILTDLLTRDALRRWAGLPVLATVITEDKTRQQLAEVQDDEVEPRRLAKAVMASPAYGEAPWSLHDRRDHRELWAGAR
jgi:hypothetical protein